MIMKLFELLILGLWQIPTQSSHHALFISWIEDKVLQGKDSPRNVQKSLAKHLTIPENQGCVILIVQMFHSILDQFISH